MNEAYWIVAQTGRVTPLTIGPPGGGKTATIQAFADYVQRDLHVLIGSIREPADIGGYPYPDQNGTRYMRLMPPKWVADCWSAHKAGKGSIIFIDELTTCPPAVQAAMLAVIAEHRVGDEQLPPETWVLCAANPPEIAANGFALEPPMANRLCHLAWDQPWEAWDQGMLNGGTFPAPDFPKLPADWERFLPGAMGRIVAFRRRKPTLFLDYPKDRDGASGAWPSPRSWTNAAICAAACESVGATADVRHQCIIGNVGMAAATEFRQWEQTLDLPDPEECIRKARDARTSGTTLVLDIPARSDKVIALMSSITCRIAEQNTKDRWEAATDILALVFDKAREIAVIAGAQLMTHMKTGYQLNAAFGVNAFGLMAKAKLI